MNRFMGDCIQDTAPESACCLATFYENIFHYVGYLLHRPLSSGEYGGIISVIRNG